MYSSDPASDNYPLKRIYYINVEESIERNIHMKEEVKRMGLESRTYRINAVNGYKSDIAEIPDYVIDKTALKHALTPYEKKEMPFQLSIGSAGLGATSYLLFRHIINTISEDDIVLILEDDVIFNDNFHESLVSQMTSLQEFPDWDISYLGYSVSHGKHDKQNKYWQKVVNVNGMFAFMIRGGKRAKRVADNLFPIVSQVDCSLRGDLNIYVPFDEIINHDYKFFSVAQRNDMLRKYNLDIYGHDSWCFHDHPSVENETIYITKCIKDFNTAFNIKKQPRILAFGDNVALNSIGVLNLLPGSTALIVISKGYRRKCLTNLKKAGMLHRTKILEDKTFDEVIDLGEKYHFVILYNKLDERTNSLNILDPTKDVQIKEEICAKGLLNVHKALDLFELDVNMPVNCIITGPEYYYTMLEFEKTIVSCQENEIVDRYMPTTLPTNKDIKYSIPFFRNCSFIFRYDKRMVLIQGAVYSVDKVSR